MQSQEEMMVTAVVGVGAIGKTVAQLLVDGGERVMLASKDQAKATALAKELGDQADAASVRAAIDQADIIVFAVWFDAIKELIAEYADLLPGKVVVDPSNALAADDQGNFTPILPEGQSAGSVIAGLSPAGAHYVKAFGSLPAELLASGADRAPQRAVLFYATDDGQAAAAAERLITAAGFDPVKAGGVRDTGRVEVFGDLHTFGGLNGKLVTAQEGLAAVEASA
ncbi:NADPH-dependent F420 reductase [Streptomyces hawaiiensis]|jgi:predicted dinucleotide-binding enzyme|uniref:NADP oxidoreductase coenzyme F420-dependent n=1 Tax=Streptomyces hawaiiensis TaxID=67305 RepID=A0A6G5R6C5_9ACTN|nr:NADP oxidoreductase coenzyme F420-dependent [Streptomyces hawaiiensis]